MAQINDLDFISELPNDILLTILSLLPVDAAVRTSVLSKRWETLWQTTPHLDLDAMHMIKPLSQPAISSRAAQLDSILNPLRYHEIVSSLVQKHKHGRLKSCKLTHFPQRDIQSTLVVLLQTQKTIDELSLECKPTEILNAQRFPGLNNAIAAIFFFLSSLEIVNYYIESSVHFCSCIKLRILKLNKVEMKDETLYEILKSCYNLESLSLVRCSKLKTTKIYHMNLKFLELRALSVYRIIILGPRLEVLDLSSLACPKPSSFKILAPRLRVFQSHCKPISHEGLVIRQGNFVLRTHEILLQTLMAIPPGFPRSYIFGDFLSSLILDLDLKIKRATQALSFVLRCFVHLETLKITTPDCRGSEFSPDDDDLQYPMLWETSDACDCVRQTLKFVSIEGFTCHQLETDFVKHLITRASNMQKIIIVWKCSEKEMSFLVPLQYQKASSNLSIMVNINAQNKSPLVQLNQLFQE